MARKRPAADAAPARSTRARAAKSARREPPARGKNAARGTKARGAKTGRRAALAAAYPLARAFSVAGRDPYEAVAWQRRDARILDADGRVVFEQRGVEAPATWSTLASDLVASRYFAGAPGTPERETSVRRLLDRVVRTIAGWVRDGGALAGRADAEAFRDDLAALLLGQRAAFNSPVLFNVGVDARPQCSACFILGLPDRLDAILDLARVEGTVFSKGSGCGTNFSRLRGSAEPTSAGGFASGPVAFLRGLDALAGAVKSGGRTRRAAKMAILDADHPDVLEFVRSKAVEESRARALEAAGLAQPADPSRDPVVAFQNENHSLRVSDDFLRRAGRGATWRLVPRTRRGTAATVGAADLLREVATAAHACGDPGLHFADTIESWNPVPRTGPIRASNPCSEFMFLDDTACNLASLNLLAFVADDGGTDVAALRAAVRLLVLAMDAIVSNASYPTDAVARNAERLRPLGLGMANLGALLMSNALPYDSDAGRGLAAGLAAVIGGEASAASADLAARLGPHAEWKRNRAPSLAVLERHRAAARALSEADVPAPLRAAALDAWDRAVVGARRHGLRNAQVTCVAPTGTIAFLMDCDTTGIEPEFALVKEKRLGGGGRLRLSNRRLAPALARLGLDAAAVARVVAHVEATGGVQGAPDLAARHHAVFDTALPAREGGRALSPRAHLAMMAAVQPFVSGAISKTVNLPASATVRDVEEVFLLSWRLGLKAVAVYRDASKVSQPLGTAPTERLGRCPECGTGVVPGGSCTLCPNCGSTTACG